jgi:hypothetical protein
MGMAQCCGGEQTAGIFSSNWIWILLILYCCGVFNEGGVLGSIIGPGGGGGLGGDDCTWMWILIALYCCCCRRRPRC